MKKAHIYTLVSASILLVISGCSHVVETRNNTVSPVPHSIHPPLDLSNEEISAYLWLLTWDTDVQEIIEHWKPAYNTLAIETLNFIGSPIATDSIIQTLSEETGQDYGYNTQEWYSWLWNTPEKKITWYDNFKAELYKNIDPRFETYFKDRGDTATIRLDEIRWWGVLQDGIPPLRSPEMITADEAEYLDDDDIVFGIEVNGDARAYPKRILAWHEMFVDTVGGIPVAGVYCTLCGTVILYETEVDGKNYEIGTSGFLYRSNKLMYDKATQSLWSTIKGEPVVGPLVWQWIQLKGRSVVTTTWGEWKKRHPETQVLSLDTGHRRDYGEWVAYNEYFSTDRLMFHTPFNDTRLKNKQEILALRFPAHPKEQLAIDINFLEENPVYYDAVGEQKFVVLTDSSGANRVYETGDVVFENYDRDSTITDNNGNTWTLTESELTSSSGEKLERLPYHRAFWFGWHAVFPESRLVK